MTHDYVSEGVAALQVIRPRISRKTYNVLMGCINRLAAYMNTGLEPEEIVEFYSRFCAARDMALALGQKYADHADELLKAESKGLLIVLPCRAGDTVWVHDRDGRPREMLFDAPDIRCHCAKEDNLCMVTCDNRRNGVCAYRLRNDGSDLGKTVFLTREEAEAALGGTDNG